MLAPLQSILREFKQFAIRGNVIDLAIGVAVGAAFGKIVTSLVNDLFTPLLAKITGGVDFTNLFWVLEEGSYPTLEAAQEAGAVTINYGIFINTILDFLIVVFVIFLVVRQMNRWKKKEEKKPTPPPRAEILLEEIRDLLKKKK